MPVENSVVRAIHFSNQSIYICILFIETLSATLFTAKPSQIVRNYFRLPTFLSLSLCNIAEGNKSFPSFLFETNITNHKIRIKLCRTCSILRFCTSANMHKCVFVCLPLLIYVLIFTIYSHLLNIYCVQPPNRYKCDLQSPITCCYNIYCAFHWLNVKLYALRNWSILTWFDVAIEYEQTHRCR